MKTIKITYRQMVAEFLLFLKKNNALNGYRNAVKEYKRSHFKTIENIINPFTIEPIKILFNPEEYRELVEGIDKKREERLKFIDQIIEEIKYARCLIKKKIKLLFAKLQFCI